MSKIIRFRSKDGVFRVNAEPLTKFGDILSELLSKSLKDVNLESVKVSSDPGSCDQASAISYMNKTATELGLENGAMLYLTYDRNSLPTLSSASVPGVSINGKSEPSDKTVQINATVTPTTATTKQLPIDDELDKDEGLIKRKKTTFCRHNDKGMCEYCSSLPPWDKSYQEQHSIKHISFHAYVDEMNADVNKAESLSSYITPLRESDFKIDKHCTNDHEPWPKGICSKCQPSSITLQTQKFRMVDHVEFQDSEIVNDFINSWRVSGTQRIGLMLGSYGRYEKVPLGIKAKVEAIYELPQLDREDGLILQKWEDEEKVLDLMHDLGLVPVGIIFTDLLDAGKGDGSVICKRHRESFFLSSLELIFAVKWQMKFPNICKWSSSGKFSSKFVTCVISGNSSGQIDIEAYQASESAEGLVKADLISPSTHPNQVFINEQNSERYVPDIMYTMVNEYGLEVKKNGKPSFPVEYLLVSLTHGFPETSSPFFKDSKKFPIENRNYIDEVPTMSDIKEHFDIKEDAGEFTSRLSNPHLLNYLLNGLQVLGPAEGKLIVKIVRELGAGDSENSKIDAYNLLESPGWKSLKMIVDLGY
ncbi:DEKNAAC100801 [Brettanomyces naardenensis]|uniref:Nuclear protein localization protein 4 n=1 Tax=Brettanomyces naardenensis TaxID=13370 RepID=A0A448YG12_BRENA|nr:DEKNAAC100801 [Brettanomyces naardenensis]